MCLQFFSFSGNIITNTPISSQDDLFGSSDTDTVTPNKKKEKHEYIPDLDAKMSKSSCQGRVKQEEAKKKLQEIKEKLVEGVKTIEKSQQSGNVNIPKLTEMLSHSVKKASEVVDRAGKAQDHFKYGQKLSYEIISKRSGGPHMKVMRTDNHFKCPNCDLKCTSAETLARHKEEFHRQQPQRSQWNPNRRTTQVCIQLIYCLYNTHNWKVFAILSIFFYTHKHLF